MAKQDLFVWDLAGTKKERLTHYKDLQRTWKVNNLVSLSFSVPKNEYNEHAYDLMQNESAIEYDGTKYIIKGYNDAVIGDTTKVSIRADHEFFTRMMKGYVYGTLPDQKRSVSEYMNFILPGLIGTPYTFSVIDSIPAKKIENFGGDYPLALFRKILDEFQIEFLVIGDDIRFYEKIGSQLAYPYRYKHNINNITRNGVSDNLSTYIKGFGKEYEENYILKGESKNLQTRTGTWGDMSDPYWWTDQKGASFQMQWYGTGIRFWYLQDPSGGVWEFTLDGDSTATLSTYGKTTGVKSVELFLDAEEKAHTIVAIFKGDDPKNKPSTGAGKSRGWVRYSSTETLKTFEVYRLRKDDEKYAVIADYTSPLANTPGIGIRPQAPVYNQDIETEADMIEYLKGVLNDKIEISYTMDVIDLAKMGGPIPMPHYGDRVPFIVEKMNILIKDIRIMELTEYPEQFKSPQITLGNYQDDYGAAAFNATKQQLDKLYDPRRGRIKIDVLEEAVKRATAALNNSLTQIEYPPNMGILLRDPTDYNRFVVLRSSGIGVTTDGGVTFPDAITADGVVTDLLTAGTIHTNNIAIVGVDALFYWDGSEFISIDPNDPNKFTRMTPGEFYVSKGAITIERPDGYKVIDNGYATFDFSVDEATPFVLSNGVTEIGRWRVMKNEANTSPGDAGYFSFKHSARYVYINLAFYCENGANGYIYIDGSGATIDENYVTFYTDHSIGNDYATYGKTFVVDLGKPTGGLRSFYVRIKSNVTGKAVNVRKIRCWLNG